MGVLDILLGTRRKLSPNRGRFPVLFRPRAAARLPTVHSVNIPILRLAAPLAACLLGAPAALAQAPLAAVPPAALAQALALASEAATALAPAGARVLALPGVLNPRLVLAPCLHVEPYLAAGMPAWGRTRVGLRCTEGAVRWNITLPVTVQVWAPAMVATAALPAGARLADSELDKTDVDWAAATQAPFATPQGLLGRTLARAVLPGQALRSSDLLPRQWFAAGEAVRVLAVGSGYAVAAEGVALTPGLEGQPARVRMAGDRVLVGRPVAERQLEVGP
jgi:flagellar basal body P-ring formation protein FlgA